MSDDKANPTPPTWAEVIAWAKEHDLELYEQLRAPFVAAFASYAADLRKRMEGAE